MRSSMVIVGLVSIILLVGFVQASGAFPRPKGLWEFNDAGNLTLATIGQDLELDGFQGGEDEPVDGIDGPGGEDGATGIGPRSYYRCTPGIPPNGFGSTNDPNDIPVFINEYSLLFDMSYPESTVGEWACILQTSQLNDGDGEYFKHPDDESWGCWDLGYTDNPVAGEFFSTSNTWYRMVFSVKLANDGSQFFNMYIDGERACTHNTTALWWDGRFSIEETVLFFADENQEDAELHISNLAIWDRPMTDQEVAMLGVPGDKIIPFVAYDPSPADGDSVSIDCDMLSWTLPEPNEPTDIVYCDVYFGTDPNNLIDKIVDNQPVSLASIPSQFTPLEVYETYYWRVDCRDDTTDTVEGFVWSFNTNNSAPDVDAGLDQRGWLVEGSVEFDLSGTVSDDGLPDPPAAFTTLWTVESGPVTEGIITDPTQLDTTAVFTELGEYVLRLEANDDVLTGYDTMTIGVFTDSCESAKSDPEFELLFGDADEDCDVDVDDFVEFASNWLACNNDECL